MEKPIRLTAHARQSSAARGVSEDEIGEAIRSQAWKEAKNGRYECRRAFRYNAEWQGQHYDVKVVRPVFVENANEVLVITVYAYYHRGNP